MLLNINHTLQGAIKESNRYCVLQSTYKQSGEKVSNVDNGTKLN